MGDIKHYRDFGLGCSHVLAGEVIIDHNFYDAAGNQEMREITDNECLPFVQITSFQPEKVMPAQNLTKDNLYDYLIQYIALKNIFLAVKICRWFEKLIIRRPFAQTKPYPSVVQVFEQQIVETITNIKGSLIGFGTPQSSRELSVAGFHLHFIDFTHKTSVYFIVI